jgi:hypothetical protein
LPNESFRKVKEDELYGKGIEDRERPFQKSSSVQEEDEERGTENHFKVG